MASNRKPRKQYRQKSVPAIPIVFGLPTSAKNSLALEPHLCLEALRTGHGAKEHVWTLANAVNIGIALSKSQSDQVKAVMACGLEAIRLVLERGKSGKWGCTGTELTAITQAVALSDELQQVSTRRQVRDAIDFAYREAA